ncbi:MAG TPA: glycosyltransferase family 4 protein [Thermoleophilaceae bacterium]
MTGSGAARARVVVLRGHHANVWDLRPLEALRGEYDIGVLVTGSNLHEVESVDLQLREVRTPRDMLPAGRAAGVLAYVAGERYLGLEERLGGTDIVHTAELGTWFSAQAARLRSRLGFRLVVTVWETIPWRDSYRWPRERRYRRDVIAAADLFLAVTERAREALLLEGVPADRIEVCPPGVDLERFRVAPAERPAADRHRIVSAGRLVWEKGHQDVLRAVAALRAGVVGAPRSDVELLVVGSGPEAARLERYAGELGLQDAVEFRPTVPYDEMPRLYASASVLVLASLPAKAWEEQFGMVLVEAQAAGTSVITTRSGAIPEVVGEDAELFAPGDWPELARLLAVGPLAGAPAARREVDRERLARFSTEAAATRLRSAYERVRTSPGSAPRPSAS